MVGHIESTHFETRVAEAVDYALLQGLLKIGPDGALAHAPFSLWPAPIDPLSLERMVALTPLFNRLAHQVARDVDFLESTLEAAARTDTFTSRLLTMAREGARTQPLYLAVNRSDYFLHQPEPGSPAGLRQVELNTISASYAGLSGLVNRLHRYLLSPSAGSETTLIPTDPIPPIADAFQQAFSLYGDPRAVVVMVVQPKEANRFDQRLLEFALSERGLTTRRLSLEEIAREGRLHEGHLEIRGEVAAVTYFRAGYGPEDFQSEAAFKARTMIEASSTIAVPGLYAQLAGTKKVQQLLTSPTLLRRYLPALEAAQVEAVFAGQFALDDPEMSAGEEQSGAGVSALNKALGDPGRFVLKPQREGGGHNFFDEELHRKLNSLPLEERSAYILMERIFPPRHQALLVRNGIAEAAQAVSEIGRFGVHLADGAQDYINRDAGYLVRSKAHGTLEGGVSAGFGYLDSLRVEALSPAAGS